MRWGSWLLMGMYVDDKKSMYLQKNRTSNAKVILKRKKILKTVKHFKKYFKEKDKNTNISKKKLLNFKFQNLSLIKVCGY